MLRASSRVHQHSVHQHSSTAHRRRLALGLGFGSERFSSAGHGGRFPSLSFAEFTDNKSLAQVSSLFSKILLEQRFPDAATRVHVLNGMRMAYCFKQLEECGIPPHTMERLMNPRVLPSRDELMEAFQLQPSGPDPNPGPDHPQWNQSGSESSARADLAMMEAATQTPAPLRSFPENYCLEFGPVRFGGLFGWCEANGVYELLTMEYVTALADHLATTTALGPILEVGAGSGRLSHFLNASGKLGVEVIATDDRSWRLDQPFSVIQSEQADAVKRFRPSVVLCSWMPENTDFTADWRRSPVVQEYILIGRADSGINGLPWETWGSTGNNLSGESNDVEQTVELLDGLASTDPKHTTVESVLRGIRAHARGELPPYRADGWERERLHDLSRLQISRVGLDSETVAFRRRETSAM